MTFFKQWDEVLYVPEWSSPEAGESAVVHEVLPLNGLLHQYYRVEFVTPSLWSGYAKTVEENELQPVYKYIYRWVGVRGPSDRIYKNKGTAKGQATINKAKLQRAKVIWEDV